MISTQKQYKMKKIILSSSVVFVMSSFTSANTDVEKINQLDLVQLGPSDCVQFARNMVLGYAAGNNMDTSSGSPEYDYLMGLFHMMYEDCLENIGYID